MRKHPYFHWNEASSDANEFGPWHNYGLFASPLGLFKQRKPQDPEKEQDLPTEAYDAPTEMVIETSITSLEPDPTQRKKPWKRSKAVRLAYARRDRPQRGKTRLAYLTLIVFSIVSLIAIGALTGYGVVIYNQQAPRVQMLANKNISQTTHIYDRNNQLLWEVYDPNQGGRATPVKLDDIPHILQDAMIATEDRTFWDNTGVDPIGIMRNVPDYMSGRPSGGGSTITQQLVKNLSGENGRNIDRKINEAMLAIALTQNYSKQKILEMYFNVTNFGPQDRGIEAAVQHYFRLQPACDQEFHCTPAVSRLAIDEHGNEDPILGLARASVLAGIPQNPSSFSPSLDEQHRQWTLQRQRVVLQRMLEEKVDVYGTPITPEMAEQAIAKAEKITFHRYHMEKKAPWFVDWIIQQLQLSLGNGDIAKGATLLNSGGFHVRTTIDSNVQQYVEAVTKDSLTTPRWQSMAQIRSYAPLIDPIYNVNDSASVVMNAKTGEIIAMNGGLDYTSKDPRVGGENNVAIARRSFGSSFKPIVYTTAFEKGLYPGIVLSDENISFPNGMGAGTEMNHSALYHTDNYDRQFNHSLNTIRASVANSFNIAAVKAASIAGVDAVLDMGRRLGLTDLDASLQVLKERSGCQEDTQCIGVAMALGTLEISLVQMVGAYQTLANGGVRVAPQAILDIYDNYGNQIYHFDPSTVQKTQVISPQIAYMMTSVLMDEHSRRLEFPGIHDLSFTEWDPTCATDHNACGLQVAAKTGTSSDFKDASTLGYTSDVVVGVWAGNADGTNLGRGVVGITGAAPIWHSIIGCLHGLQASGAIACTNMNNEWALGFRAGRFPRPDGLVDSCVARNDGLQGGGHCDVILPAMIPQSQGLNVQKPEEKKPESGEQKPNTPKPPHPPAIEQPDTIPSFNEGND